MHKGHVYYHCTQFKGKHGAKWLREEEITRQLERIFKNLQVPPEIAKEIIYTLEEIHENKMEFQGQQFDNLTKEQNRVGGSRKATDLPHHRTYSSYTAVSFNIFFHKDLYIISKLFNPCNLNHARSIALSS